MLIVVAVSSCAIHTTSLQGQYDKRIERLQRERDKLARITDPVSRAKTDITISEILLSLAGDAVKTNEPELLTKRLNEYTDTIRDAHQVLMNTNRDARRSPKGFKDLEIALRRQIRILDDLAHAVTFDQRDPVEKAKQQASDLREELLKALFGEQNAPSRKS
jgi:uncharacterized coiled-coil protein SlyX